MMLATKGRVWRWTSLAGVVAVSMLVQACGDSGPSATPTPTPTSDRAGDTVPARRACDTAIFTARVPRGSTPRAVNAHVIGAAIFNDLKGARTALEGPTEEVPFYTYKSALTVWGRAAVRVSIVEPRDDVRLIYDPRSVRDLGQGRLDWPRLRRDTQFEVCAERSHGRLATQYNGGFVLRHPACVTIRAQGLPGHGVEMRTVRFGDGKCRD